MNKEDKTLLMMLLYAAIGVALGYSYSITSDLSIRIIIFIVSTMTLIAVWIMASKYIGFEDESKTEENKTMHKKDA